MASSTHPLDFVKEGGPMYLLLEPAIRKQTIEAQEKAAAKQEKTCVLAEQLKGMDG
jgi:hypothetical protein